METHSNKMFVSFILALLVAAVVAFALWMSAPRRSTGRPYDIVIAQSVTGLVVGSPVTFLGVPVGRVTSVELDPVQPGAARVRIDITDDDLPIVEGTVARLNGDLLFGTALISLENASRSASPLLARAGQDVPVIPLQSGGMADLVSDPTPMVESIAFGTDRLLAMTSPEQQRELIVRLEEMARSSAEMATRAPGLRSRIAGTRQSLQESAASAAETSRQIELMRSRVERSSRTGTRELRASLAAARDAADALSERLKTARVQVATSSETAAGTGQKIAEAREGVAALSEQLEGIERGGIGALISGPPTPDYRPRDRR